MISANILYTVRVLIAWWIILQIRQGLTYIKPNWSKLLIFYISVFIGAELTFIVDYFIFNNMSINLVKYKNRVVLYKNFSSCLIFYFM